MGERRETLGDLKSVKVRKRDVEKDNVRTQASRCRDRRRALSCLPHDCKSLVLEQRARRPPELVVVIDYDDGQRHGEIVADRVLGFIVASTSRAASTALLLDVVGYGPALRCGGCRSIAQEHVT